MLELKLIMTRLAEIADQLEQNGHNDASGQMTELMKEVLSSVQESTSRTAQSAFPFRGKDVGMTSGGQQYLVPNAPHYIDQRKDQYNQTQEPAFRALYNTSKSLNLRPEHEYIFAKGYATKEAAATNFANNYMAWLRDPRTRPTQ